MNSRSAWLMVVGIVSMACHPTAAERVTVRRWLLCEECNEGERDSVVALGDRVSGALREAVQGPPSWGRENIRSQAEAAYARLASPAIPQQVYVQHFLDNYVARYQLRAALALGLIGTPRAHAILLEAVQSDSAYRDDVLRALGTAAQVSLAQFAGDLQSAPIDSIVRVNPAVLVRDSLSGQSLRNVKVVFQVESGGGRVIDSVQRTSAAGLASVRWQLGPSADSVNVLRVAAAGRTVRFSATGRGFTPRLVFVVQPRNGRSGQPLDTVVVVAVDAWGQTDSTFTKPALLTAIGTPDSLIGSFSAGRAFFPGLVIDSVSTGLRLRVAALGATPAMSASFDIRP